VETGGSKPLYYLFLEQGWSNFTPSISNHSNALRVTCSVMRDVISSVNLSATSVADLRKYERASEHREQGGKHGVRDIRGGAGRLGG